MTDSITQLTPDQLEDDAAPTRAGFKSFHIDEFLGLEIEPREYLLAPWLPEQGLCALHAYRGVGKTHVALGVGFAVATGGDFLGWKAPSAKSVLYIDGEMPAVAMQERLANIVKASQVQNVPAFQILTPDFQKSGPPNLASPASQTLLEPLLEGVDLIILDNISTLVRTTHSENDDKSWSSIQEWLLHQRAQHRAVLMIHHEGKSGKQRGTSKREDVLDTVIQLRQPSDYEPSMGACFDVEFKKNRGFYGDDAKPFQAQLDPHTSQWTTTDLEDATYDRVVTLTNDGLNQSDIAFELGVNKSGVSRHLKRARSEGLINKR